MIQSSRNAELFGSAPSVTSLTHHRYSVSGRSRPGSIVTTVSRVVSA